MRSPRIIARIAWVAVALTFLVSVTLCLRHIGRPRTIARAVAPDGTEMCIVQQCNWGFEPFTTSFVYRKPGTNWGWFYYDHEDGYWRAGRATLDLPSQTAVFYRGSAPAVTFNWASETYTLHRFGRTLTKAQRHLSPTWSPNQSVYR